MRKLNLLLIILFVVSFSDAVFAKKAKYVSAHTAMVKVETDFLSTGSTGKDGITIRENGTRAVANFYFKKKKLKKLIFYADLKSGNIVVILAKVDLKNGLVYDHNGNLISEGVILEETFNDKSTSLEMILPKGLKKKKNELWLISVDLNKGADENLPELYGIRYK